MSPIRPDHQPIYNRLPVLRAEWGVSRSELAAHVNVNVQTIGALERGDHYPSLELAFRLSEYFDLPVESIFSRAPFTPQRERYLRATQGHSQRPMPHSESA